MILLLQLLLYTLTLWLGLYLIQRDWRDGRLLWTGLGLLFYAGAIAVLIVRLMDGANLSGERAALFPIHYRWLLALPALCWSGASLSLLAKNHPFHTHLERFWRYGQWPLVLLLAPLFVAAGATASGFERPLQLLLAAIVLVPLALVMVLLLRQRRPVPEEAEHAIRSAYARKPPQLFNLLWMLMPMFGLSTAALLLPFEVAPPSWLIALMGLDLLLLGFAIGGLDAFSQGETLLPDLLLALDEALLYIFLFGGLVAVTILLSTGPTPAMLTLLLATIGAAIAVQAFQPQLQQQIDRLALRRDPALIEERAELRALGDTLPRLDPIRAVNLDDEEEFVRQIRRALSHMDDLTKLSANPLIALPIVQEQLVADAEVESTLARAQTLKMLLERAIQQLKPPGTRDFEPTAAWRHYNALYFPYVVGLKPYSRRAIHDELDAATTEALDWFRSQVPERTLHNWQNAAARLVAKHILELHKVAFESTNGK